MEGWDLSHEDSDGTHKGGPMMRISRRTGWLLAACVALMVVLLPTRSVSGDIGPKPDMEFNFIREKGLPAITITKAVLLQCGDPACADAHPLEQLGPQGITCQEMSCSSMAYSYADYHRLRVTFSDGVTRQSNVFDKHAFHAAYRVTVGQNDLRVKEGLGSPNSILITLLGSLVGLALLVAELGLVVVLAVQVGKDRAGWEASQGIYWTALVIGLALTVPGGLFSLALPLTVLVETLLAAGYARWRRRPVFPLVVVVLAMNVFTQFGLWGVLENLRSGHALVFTLALEVGIWLVEALILFFTGRKTFSWNEAALLGLLLNAHQFYDRSGSAALGQSGESCPRRWFALESRRKR